MLDLNIYEIALMYWVATGAYLLGYVSDKYQEYKWWGIVVGVVMAFILVPIQIVRVIPSYIRHIRKLENVVHIKVAIKVLLLNKNVWAKWSDESVEFKCRSVEKHLIPEWEKTLIGRINIKTFRKLQQLNKHRI